MKLQILTGLACFCASAALGQTPTSNPPAPGTAAPGQTVQTLTLTGCVGGGNNSSPFTLADAMVIPTTQAPAAPAVASPAIPPATPAVPPTAAAAPPATPAAVPPTTPAAVPPATPAAVPPSAVGTSGTAASGTPSSPTPGTPGAVGTAGSVAPAAPGMNGYALSGIDMSGWTGRRVQIVGRVVPPGSGAAAGSATPGLTGFRVQSVIPTDGNCPQR